MDKNLDEHQKQQLNNQKNLKESMDVVNAKELLHMLFEEADPDKSISHLLEYVERDPMTGLGDRRAAMRSFAQRNTESSLGIVFCDVCGLKKINDTLGHEERDRLLLRASECLKSYFGEYELFRYEEDEFLVLAAGIDENHLIEKCEWLRRSAVDAKAPLAVGYLW